MDIQSLLCNTNQSLEISTTKSPTYKQIHERQSSWSSYSSSPDSPMSLSSNSSLFYSIPSSPEIDSPSPPSPTRGTRPTNQTRTPWSSDEDILLQQGYSQGLSWAMISTVYLPHRSRGCCWGRFKTLQSKSLDQREWTDAEDRLLMLAIKKNSRLFKQAWKAVAQDMGNRNWKECEQRSISKASVSKKKH
ncbi:hypothetical protein INT47_005856 [Mucor saturninus]|uniref:Myb-like domain-containing protein n=1 Tax=Mucor saturninus TaxID=64648 RepID=A0A8H7QGU9_9FUNG|nr:hypothetical protein INT47_005856 [Mucor saturninus]